jgi:hypothetical protein
MNAGPLDAAGAPCQHVAMPRLLLAILASLFAIALPAAAQPRTYEEGQVWEYRTRPQDAGSLLRIHRIAPDPHEGAPRTVYHISLIGVRLGGPDAAPAPIGHLPVARQTLDASVLRLSDARPQFADTDEGIAIWTADENAGVFDIPVAEIVDVAEAAIRQQDEQPVIAAASAPAVPRRDARP